MFDFLKPHNINAGVDEFKATKGAVLLDVRSRDEYLGGHVPGSTHVDAREINKVSLSVNDEQTPLFVYCLSGSRSGMAVNALKSMGYSNVKNIGGISSYTGRTEKGA